MSFCYLQLHTLDRHTNFFTAATVYPTPCTPRQVLRTWAVQYHRGLLTNHGTKECKMPTSTWRLRHIVGSETTLVYIKLELSIVCTLLVLKLICRTRLVLVLYRLQVLLVPEGWDLNYCTRYTLILIMREKVFVPGLHGEIWSCSEKLCIRVLRRICTVQLRRLRT